MTIHQGTYPMLHISTQEHGIFTSNDADINRHIMT